MNENAEQKSIGKQFLAQVIGVYDWIKRQVRTNPLPCFIVVILLGVLAWIVYETARLDNLGFGVYIEPDTKGEYHRGKTLWDWMELFIIPIVLAIGAWWLNKSERENERKIAEENRKEDKEIAQKNRKQDRAIADDRRNQAILEAYLDRMTELLLRKDGLRESQEGDEVRSIARTRTLAVLRSLDGHRKGQVVQFLYESDLIGPKLVVVLLNGAGLDGAELVVANLDGANLIGAYLARADLRGAKLTRANLSGAFLSSANLIGADLGGAYLAGADLTRAKPMRANLSGANLYGADLSGAKLHWADLSGAKVTDEQLAQAESLKGATLPDGTKHE